MTSETGDVRPFSMALDGVWRVFSDLRMTLALIALALLSAAVAAQGDAGALAATRLDTPALRVLLALLAFNLLLRLALHVERAARLWSPRYLPPPAIGAPAVELEPASWTEETRAQAETVWRRTFSHVLTAEPPDAALYGARRRAGIAGPLLAASGALLFLAGLWLNAALGWSEGDILLTGGAEVSLAQLAGATLALEQTEAAAAQPVIALNRPTAGAERLRVTPGRPARAAAGLWLVAREGGPTLEAAGRDDAARPLDLLSAEPGADPQTALSLPFPPTQAEQAFSVPAAGLVFRAVSYSSLPERGAKGPVFLVEAYREGDASAVASLLVQDGAQMSLDGAIYTLQRGRYLDVQAAYLPGWPFLAVGALLTAVGSLLAVFLGAREGWVSFRGGTAGRVQNATIQTLGGLTPARDARALADQLVTGGAAVSIEQGDR